MEFIRSRDAEESRSACNMVIKRSHEMHITHFMAPFFLLLFPKHLPNSVY